MSLLSEWRLRTEQREILRARANEELKRSVERERMSFDREKQLAQLEAVESTFQQEQIELLTAQTRLQRGMAAEINGKNIFNDSDAGTLFDLYQFTTGDAISESDYCEMLRNAYQAWATDSYAHGWIETFTKFVVGMSCRLRHEDGNEQAQEILDEFMAGYDRGDGTREKPWTHKANEWVRRGFRDGETFTRKFYRADGRIWTRFLTPMFFRSVRGGTPDQMYGIQTDPDDIERVIQYFYQPNYQYYGSPYVIPIPASQMIHTKLGESDAKRGRPLLLPVIADLVEFTKLLTARRKMHRLRTLYAVQRKLLGTAAVYAAQKHAKDRVQASANADATGATERAPQGPSIQEHGENIEYEFKTPNLQAQDADDDLKWHGSKILVGLGLTPQVGFAGAISQTYSEGELSESPMITTMKMWQGFFGCDFCMLGEEILKEAQSHGRLDTGLSTEVCIDWPIINPRDIEKETRALALQSTIGWMDDRTAIQRLGNDPDTIMEGLEQDTKRKGVTNPLNLTNAELSASLAGSAGRNGKGNADKVGLVPKSIKRIVGAGNGNGRS